MNHFDSQKNKEVLTKIIKDDLHASFRIQNFPNLQKYLNETMNYVKMNVSKETPSSMSDQKYLLLLNKKVYSVIMPILQNKHKQMVKTNEMNNPKKESEKIQQNLFDADILKNYKQNDDVIDYPKPAASDNKEVDSYYNKIQEERQLMYPEVKDIQFKVEEEKENNTMEKYNKLMNGYNSQMEDVIHFEESQKNMNTKIDKIADKIEQSPLKPVNIPVASNIEKETPDSIENFQNFLSNNQNEIKRDTQNIEIQYNNNDLLKNTVQYSDVNIRGDAIMLKKPNYQQILKTDSIIVNSRNRNLELFPIQTEFIVKFAPNDNTYLFSSYKDENDVYLIQEKKIVIGNYSENDIGETFDNIKYVECKSVIVPTHSYEYIGAFDNEDITDDFGLTLFKDSYLLLQIPELRGPYRGGTKQVKNALVILSINHGNNLQNLRISSNFSNLVVGKEIMEYDPVTLGKLDKFTIQLNNKNGKLYNFGIDKLYVQNFTKGELKYLGPCGKKTYSTKFEIQRENEEYSKYCSYFYNATNCTTVNDNPLNVRDLLYFYKTIPNEDELVLFEKVVKLDSIQEKGKTIQIGLRSEKNNTSYSVNIERLFQSFMSSEDKITDFYIILIDNGQKYAFQINKVTKQYIIINKYPNFPNFIDYNTILVGITKGNKKGVYDENKNSLFNFNGYNVIGIKNTKDSKTLGKFIIEIDYPWDLLPKTFQENLFSKSDIFFIQDKKQINYVFSITYHVKDYNQLDSYLNESGNN